MKLMERILFNLFIICVWLLMLCVSPVYSHGEIITAPMWIYFSPEDDVITQILKRIDESNTSIYILVYSFTDRDIANALIRAHKRGVNVQLIIDGGQTDHYRTQADEVQHAGIPTYSDTKYVIAHDKVMIFDEKIVLTGSYNMSFAARTRNSENVIFIYSEEVAKKYKDRWDYRKKYTHPYQ